MPSPISSTETQVFTALRTVLGTFGLAPSTIPIIRGQVNRTPEPSADDFVVAWPLMRQRLAMNVDDWTDNILTGSITANVMTVSAVLQGEVEVALPLYGSGVAAGCTIAAQLTGTPGGIGTYSVTATPNIGSRTLYCGVLDVEQSTEMTIQLDVHGPLSADNAQRISTLMRDQYAVSAFLETELGVAPLSATDPRQMPFLNGEQQIEERWIVDCCLQVNPVVSVTQQFADTLEITTVSVEAAYPIS